MLTASALATAENANAGRGVIASTAPRWGRKASLTLLARFTVSRPSTDKTSGRPVS